MEATISIPKHWGYLKAITNSQFASRNYLTANCDLRLANCFCWRYTVLPDKHTDEVRHYSDDQLQTLSVAEIQEQLQAEIEEHQQQIKVLQQQLVAIGGSNDG
ncbi:hypothetical protein NIES2109_60660 (plasmid) [Nostoc sp. HK-01]|nr:hypothetical protein NIES2109_60660 [Nostoc sp. HK-01]